MHITKIELEDIKSHIDSKFEFERGTTAIIGENGAGKTTIIETVAWTLFDLLDYKKDDFVRRGAKKGVARVTFESGLDERRYVVHRDTKTAYYVYDPKLKTRIADKKEEVTRFLWQHLGAEAGTDLESLFRRAIGVPQGTFTAIFLEAPTERKRAFDKLLKVEEYRQSADKLRDTVKYIDGKISGTRENIARGEGELARFDSIKEDLKTIKADEKKLQSSIKTLEKEADGIRKIVKEFEKVESRVTELKNALKTLQNEKSKADVIKSQREKEKSLAQDAAERIKRVEGDYQNHIKALGRLKELERERAAREKLTVELTKVEAAIVNVNSEKRAAAEDRKKIVLAHQEIETLKPKLKEQQELEKERETIRNLLSEGKAAQSRLLDVDQKLESLRDRYRENQKQKQEAEKKSVEAKHLRERQEREEKLREKLARLYAGLERDQKFQKEIENGLCPVLTEKCLNLKEGQTLDDFVMTKFSDVKAEIGTLESEKKELGILLKASRDGESFLATLASIEKREKEIANDGAALKAEKEALKKRAGDLDRLNAKLKAIETRLTSLDDPKMRIQLLEKETTREISIREQATKIESNLERLESDRRLKIEQLETYKDLDANWKEFSELRDNTSDAHREYLANETAAKSLPEKTKLLETLIEENRVLTDQLMKAESELKTESKDFDHEKYLIEKEELAKIDRQLVETKLNYQHLSKRRDELEKELKRLEEIRETLKIEIGEKERLQKMSDVTAFIRTTLKEAAPRVARNYVHHVSLEANQLYREIMGNPERTLKWVDDYGVFLEEDGYERPFQNLSGGEQMAAALSIRLALLKQLSDIRMAFFDEPTMNMDAERREHLAEQISQITAKQTFDQLFVISHDDTFEGYVDNVITVTAN